MTLTIDLPEREMTLLQAKASAEGVPVEQYARQVLEQDLESDKVTPRRPLSEVIREIWADIPDEVRAILPADGASQVDHYVYGLPKRDE
jgi:hypothetical protein